MIPSSRFWIKGGIAVLLTAGIASPVLADGGVTFTNASPSLDITYERFPTPARQADMEAIYAAGVPFPPGVTFPILGETPQKPRGAPGVGLLDYDNDGDVDVYVTNGPGHANSLYRNKLADTGKLGFVDVAASAHVQATAQDSSGVCYGDVDNDGDEDLYVTGIAMPNVLFRNNGDGTFTDITAAAKVGGGTFHHSGCAMADFNGDGRLDIAVSNTYGDWLHRRVVFLPTYDSVEPNQLFLQRRNGRGDIGHAGASATAGARPAKAKRPDVEFIDASATSGIRDLGPYANLNGGSYTWGIAAVDYDQDGDPDIMWADTNGPPPANSPQDDRGWIRTLQNDGQGHFTDVSQAVGTAKTGAWMGLSYGDFNCDGAMDFFCTNLGDYVGGPANQSRWFLGDGNGGFTDPGIGPNFKASLFGWGTSVVDYDNDGDQDIFYFGDDDLLNLIALDNKGAVLQNHGCRADFSYDTATLKTDNRLREVNGEAAGDLNGDGWQDIVTVASFRINPIPSRLLPITRVTGPLDPLLDTISQVLLVMARTAITDTKLKLLPGLDVPNGDLAIELNSGGNGNGSLQVRTLGTVGILERGKTNRDGMGVVLKFTPEGGKTVITPVMGGGSHASQDSRVAHFGLGTATKGTVEVLWQGGARNVLFDVRKGEKVTIPEIPCDYNRASWKNYEQFSQCVENALAKLQERQVIGTRLVPRIRDSATRAFFE